MLVGNQQSSGAYEVDGTEICNAGQNESNWNVEVMLYSRWKIKPLTCFPGIAWISKMMQ